MLLSTLKRNINWRKNGMRSAAWTGKMERVKGMEKMTNAASIAAILQHRRESLLNIQNDFYIYFFI